MRGNGRTGDGRDARRLRARDGGGHSGMRGALERLIRLGLLDAAEVVRGDVAALDLSSRHRNVAVLRRDRPGFHVKQGASARGAAAVRHESAVLNFLAYAPPALSLRVPRPVFRDSAEGLLVLDRVSVTRTPASGGPAPPRAAAELGAALAALHRLPFRALAVRPPAGGPDGAELPRFAGRSPWVLSLHRPSVDDLATLSAANLDLIRLLQSRTGLCVALDRMRRRWRTTSLLHNDLRRENCLVVRTSAAGRPRLLIVDWEMADVGDPAWDLGSVLAQWLGAPGAPWLRRELPDGSGARVRDVTAADGRAASRAFWRTYCRRAVVDEPAAERLLLASMHYAAARLVQAGYEEQQAAVRLRPRPRALVDLACDVLRRPRRAAGALLADDGPARVRACGSRPRVRR